MSTTHRSELVTKIADALTDEAYDGGMGPMSETEFPRHVLRLAETAVEVIVEAAEDLARSAFPWDGTEGRTVIEARRRMVAVLVERGTGNV